MSVSVQLVVISVTLSLANIVAYQSLRNVNVSDAVRSGRYRRSEPLPMTAEQKKAVVDYHNELRADEGADNMELMIYNESLAKRAEDWAAGCIFTHPSRLFGMGQNIYAATHRNKNPNPRWAIKAWFSEKADYDYDAPACATGKPCGHYTQIVWATTRSVGCAYHRCTPLKQFKDATYFVCNYWPGGNYVGAKPYTKGPACSKCGDGAGWCKDKLCNWQCSSPEKDCSCAVHCFNCAKLDNVACRCSCADGWRGDYCTVPCKDKSDLCGAKGRGWHPQHCSEDNNQHKHVRNLCPAMCKVCTANPNAEQCPPVYGPDAYLSSGKESKIKSHHATVIVMVTIVVTFSSNASL